MPTPISPATAILACLAGFASCPSPAVYVCGQTVPFSLSPLSHLHSSALSGTLLSPHMGQAGLLCFPMGLLKLWEKSFLSFHCRAILKLFM